MKLVVLLVALLSVGTSGIALAQQHPGTMPERLAQASPPARLSSQQLLSGKAAQWLNEHKLAVTTSPEEAFVNDYILAVGEGVPMATATSPAQKRLTAERAATISAYRQLAEFVHGVPVVGETLVQDAMLQYDVVKTAVEGFIQGAQVIYKEWKPQDESALVLVKMGMTGPKGFGSVLYEKLLGDPGMRERVIEPKPAYTPQPASLPARFDGLILDATEQHFRPALINRVLTSKGEIVYDPSKISQKVLVEQGCGEYTNSIDKARAALEQRGTKNPLVIKAIGTMSPSDLQISDEDAARLSAANQDTGFLAGAKVAFVLK